MAKARQQVSGPPLQEVVEGVGGTLLHPDLVAVAPDLQTGQRHADVQRPVELKQEVEVVSVRFYRHGGRSDGDRKSEVSPSPPGWPRPAGGR